MSADAGADVPAADRRAGSGGRRLRQRRPRGSAGGGQRRRAAPAPQRERARSGTGWRSGWKEPESNRDGYGAAVTVTAAGKSAWTRQCHADGSFQSSSDKRVHFGLGRAVARPSAASCSWPSGHTGPVVHTVRADRIISMREGVGRTSCLGTESPISEMAAWGRVGAYLGDQPLLCLAETRSGSG